MLDIEELIEKLQSIKLLYVEDNLEARESTMMLFEDIFEEITVAVDGIDGLEKFKKDSFDLIITDVSMPNLDGLEMSSKIKKIDKEVSIIALSALNDTTVTKRAREIGINHILTKPLEDIDVLFEKLNIIVHETK